MPWYVVYTKSRTELKTTERLLGKDIIAYCPAKEVVRQWSDRKMKIIEPLFRSYVFVKLDDFEKEQVRVLHTAGVVRFLWWLGKPGVVREDEIDLIKEFLNNESYSGVTATSIEAGDDVKILDGPLKDAEARILEIRGKKAVLILRSIGWKIIADLSVKNLQKQ